MDLKEAVESTIHRHPWEIARAESLLGEIEKMQFSSIADIGAGDLYFTNNVANLTGEKIYACDINYQEKDLFENKSITKIIDIDDIPKETVDLVLLLDVLEHIEDEDDFLQKVKDILSKGGRILITLPAFQFLFSEHDVFLKHYRRYTKKQLTKLLLKNNLSIEKTYYFYSSLFFVRVLMKMLSFCGLKNEYKNEVGNWKYGEEHIITRFFVKMLNLDYNVNVFLNSSLKTSFPGLSVLAVVRKSDE